MSIVQLLLFIAGMASHTREESFENCLRSFQVLSSIKLRTTLSVTQWAFFVSLSTRQKVKNLTQNPRQMGGGGGALYGRSLCRHCFHFHTQNFLSA